VCRSGTVRASLPTRSDAAKLVSTALVSEKWTVLKEDMPGLYCGPFPRYIRQSVGGDEPPSILPDTP
jgi:hypothetical protein